MFFFDPGGRLHAAFVSPPDSTVTADAGVRRGVTANRMSHKHELGEALPQACRAGLRHGPCPVSQFGQAAIPTIGSLIEDTEALTIPWPRITSVQVRKGIPIHQSEFRQQESKGRAPMKHGTRSLAIGVAVTAVCAAVSQAQFTQQGTPLVGTGTVGRSFEVSSLAISGDGNTAIIGDVVDDSYAGAAWVFTRTNGVWTQQTKIPGWREYWGFGFSVAFSGAGNLALFPVAPNGEADYTFRGLLFRGLGGIWSVETWLPLPTLTSYYPVPAAVSAYGNAAIMGIRDYPYGTGVGAAWVFTRVGGVWWPAELQHTGDSHQGMGVSLCADGGTAAVAGFSYLPDRSGVIPTAWLYQRSGGVWNQEPPVHLVPADVTGESFEFWSPTSTSVALSADGNTAAIGDSNAGGSVGSVWVFVRCSDGSWVQQGPRVLGREGADSQALQGAFTALSADGNTLVEGGYGVWVFTRSGGSWTQLGGQLKNETGGAATGPVAISGDGATVLTGGPAIPGTSISSALVFTTSQPSVASALAFLQQPTSTRTGQPITPPVTVQLEDGAGSAVSQSGVAIYMSSCSGTGALTGTALQLTDARGLATFGDLSIDLPGPSQLQASSGGLTAAVSQEFIVVSSVRPPRRHLSRSGT